MKLGLTVLLGLLAFVLASCGGKERAVPLDQIVPSAPENETFSSLYNQLATLLNERSPQTRRALAETRSWAVANLDGFTDGACADSEILSDGAFARSFGRNTLGVTFPWMLIYIRDGLDSAREEYLWKNISLFASTVLHEFVHAAQRARQATQYLGSTAQCASARDSLNSRRNKWITGFDGARWGPIENIGLDAAEKSLIYRWTSPILRAKDEVEAATITVRWMHQHPDQLNLMTLGGANNWLYAYQYLNQLRNLAGHDCFSPDESTFQEEMRVYSNELPVFIQELADREQEVLAFFRQNSVDVASLDVRALASSPAPSGRVGSRCTSSALVEVPRFPLRSPEKQHIRIAPIAID